MQMMCPPFLLSPGDPESYSAYHWSPWDLEVVLGTLQCPTFEPLGDVDLKWLSFKTTLLFTVPLAGRMSELHALSVHGDCCWFLPHGSRVVLHPNPAFLPKVLTEFHLSQSVELRSLLSPSSLHCAQTGP